MLSTAAHPQPVRLYIFYLSLGIGYPFNILLSAVVMFHQMPTANSEFKKNIFICRRCHQKSIRTCLIKDFYESVLTVTQYHGLMTQKCAAAIYDEHF